jgi:hypothetical protein
MKRMNEQVTVFIPEGVTSDEWGGETTEWAEKEKIMANVLALAPETMVLTVRCASRIKAGSQVEWSGHRWSVEDDGLEDLIQRSVSYRVRKVKVEELA